MLRWILSRFDKRVADELYNQKKLILAGLACSAGAAAIAGVLVKLIETTTRALEAKNAGLLYWMAAGVIALFAVKYFLTRGQAFYLTAASIEMTSKLREKILLKLQKLPLRYFDSQRAGNVQSVFTNDVNVYTTAVGTVRESIDGPIKIAAGLITAASIQPYLLLGAMVVFPVIFLVIQNNAKKMKSDQARVQEDLGDLNAFTAEAIQGTRTVKVFGAEQQMITNFLQRNDVTVISQKAAARRFANLKPLVEFIGAFAVAIVVVICALLVQRDLLRVSQLTGFLFALDLINQGFRNLGSMKQTRAQIQAAADRIYSEVLDVPDDEVHSGENKSLPDVTGQIVFDQVSFQYPDGTTALENVSFTIEPGTSVALVGPSGAGKSTISDLLLRIHDPSSGRITLDGTDLRELDISWLRSQMGVVPQSTFLFAGTLAENLRLAKPDATDQELLQAAEAANASFIVNLPAGFQSTVGERGVRLSGGEAQRIAIARAILRNPKVLILDEATSSLDAMSEKAVQQALDDVMVNRSTLFIAHRLTTAARATKIVVLRHGKVVEQGAFQELMDAKQVFASMYETFRDEGAPVELA
jgi:subfamily B ATP-binding cassette protein MsbA